MQIYRKKIILKDQEAVKSNKKSAKIYKNYNNRCRYHSMSNIPNRNLLEIPHNYTINTKLI